MNSKRPTLANRTAPPSHKKVPINLKMTAEIWSGLCCARGDAMIRVGIADDHKVVREALRRLLMEEGDLRVVGEAATGHEAMALVQAEAMDVLVLDLTMPGRSGFDVLASLRARVPSLSLLVFSGHPEATYARMALKEGAHGFVNKASDPSELILAIRRVAGGNRYLSASLAQQFATEVCARKVQPDQRLSKREFQVLLEIASGRKPRAIGKHLCLSAKTVTLYRARLLQKLQLTTNTELTKFAIQQGLLN